jgi:uncharacterized protein
VSNPWLVPITSLRRSIGSQREEHRSGRLAELTVAGTSVPPEAEVAVDVVLTSVSGGVEVAGTVLGPWQGECRRCLEPVRGEITSEVRELYRPPDTASPDEDTYDLGNDYLDLQPLARDALLLDLPLAPLCRPDCEGLCPVCGADRNAEPCGCAHEVVDPRWAALGVLRPDRESTS